MVLVIEADPGIYTSISLTQKTLKASPGYHFLREHIHEVNYVIQKPRILLIKHGDQVSSDDLTCLLGHAAETGCHSIMTDLVENCKRWTCPFAIVVLLSASGGHGSCRLSGFDFDILDEIKKNFKDFGDITFIIKDSMHSVKYSSEDLDLLSKEIHFKIYGTNHTNNVYHNTFLSNDDQVSVRIGLRMHKSIQKHLFNIQKCSQNLVNEINNQYGMRKVETKLKNPKVEEQAEKIRIFCSLLEDECTNSRLHGVSIHELKILPYRHKKVSGFGYIDGAICVYLNGSIEEDKKEVFTFFEKYVDTTEYDFKIEFRKQREITYFAKLENGSRINKIRTAGKGPKGYGTLGMFLEDSSGTYFFTSCAHVIGKDAIAYFPDDNTKIGENVFVCHPNTNNNIKHAQKMDFSLIRVCPDFDIECTLGLKSVNGNFIKGVIFKGDISELLGRRLYKWGATEPHLQTGKCTGIEEEEFIYIQISTENFAKPGDSGAIICAGSDNDTALAAFVLVGEWTERKTTYVVYKIADALDIVAKMTEEMKPWLCTKTFTVVSASNHASSARA